MQGERLLAESRHGIFIVGREQFAPGVATVTVFDPQNKVAPFLERLGVTVRPLETGHAPEGPIIVVYAAPREELGVKKFAALLRHLQEGATALWLDIPPAAHFLVTSNAFPFVPNRQPAKGMWIPVNHYVRPPAVFDGLPTGGFMGQVYQDVVPQFTLRDLPGAPLAGCVSWDHNKDYTGPTEVWHGSSLTAIPRGRGRLILSLFNIADHLGNDPVADKLLMNPTRPFFLYRAYSGPHTPLAATPERLARFPGQMPERRRSALAMLATIDDGVGRIMETLCKHGLEENTLIVFTSDNGAPLKLTMPDAPMTSGPDGKQIEMGGWDGSHNAPQLLPHLTGENPNPPHETLYWRFWKQAAVRAGQWKLLHLGDGTDFLFDLSQPDPETRNLAAQHPEKTAELREKLEAWTQQLRPPGLPKNGIQRERTWYQHYLNHEPGKPSP